MKTFLKDNLYGASLLLVGILILLAVIFETSEEPQSQPPVQILIQCPPSEPAILLESPPTFNPVLPEHKGIGV